MSFPKPKHVAKSNGPFRALGIDTGEVLYRYPDVLFADDAHGIDTEKVMYRYRASKIAFGLFARLCLGPTGSQHAQCLVFTLRAISDLFPTK